MALEDLFRDEDIAEIEAAHARVIGEHERKGTQAREAERRAFDWEVDEEDLFDD